MPITEIGKHLILNERILMGTLCNRGRTALSGQSDTGFERHLQVTSETPETLYRTPRTSSQKS
jgi:hypothetical protein